MFSSTRKQRSPRIGSLLLFLLLLLLVIFAAPRVTSVQPSPDAEFIPISAELTLTFSRPMDKIAVESRLTIEPAQTGTFTWQGNSITFSPDEPWPEGQDVNLFLKAGARSAIFLPILRSRQWTFSIGYPRIIYLWPADTRADIYARTIDGGQTTRLTESDYGVLDFSVIEDQAKLIYTRLRADRGTDLWLLNILTGEEDLLFACPSGWRCQEPRLSPNSEEVAFEQQVLSEGPGSKMVLGPAYVRRIFVEDNSQAFPIIPDDPISSSPIWSPLGLLTFYDAVQRQILVVEPLTDTEPIIYGSFPSELGVMGSWSFDGKFFVYPEMIILDEKYAKNEATGDEFPLFFSHIYRQTLDSSFVEDLSGDVNDLFEDSSPKYSPDGRWIAFTRKFLLRDQWTPGRQLWVMRSDGSQARQITTDPKFGHQSLEWNRGGSAIVFVRSDQTDLGAEPQIWIYDFELDSLSLLSTGGYSPQWIQ
ncbi:MAG: Ig-like domain-containing protein [Chloroflexi bacterium]|nr:Ig-like domain-containing protein [Chloroflexota bacterium]